MGKARKPVKINRKNRGNQVKIRKMIEQNNTVLKKLKSEI